VRDGIASARVNSLDLRLRHYVNGAWHDYGEAPKVAPNLAAINSALQKNQPFPMKELTVTFPVPNGTMKRPLALMWRCNYEKIDAQDQTPKTPEWPNILLLTAR
jgi:hypothetical protein